MENHCGWCNCGGNIVWFWLGREMCVIVTTCVGLLVFNWKFKRNEFNILCVSMSTKCIRVGGLRYVQAGPNTHYICVCVLMYICMHILLSQMQDQPRHLTFVLFFLFSHMLKIKKKKEFFFYVSQYLVLGQACTPREFHRLKKKLSL